LAGVGVGVVSGKKPRRLPTVLTREEAGKVLRQMKGIQQLVASVLYGSGLRLSEGLQLRLKDLDLAGRELRVRELVSVVPGALLGRLTDQIEKRRAIHDQDLAAGFGWAALPGRYATKSPKAGAELG
jgi:integrase